MVGTTTQCRLKVTLPTEAMDNRTDLLAHKWAIRLNTITVELDIKITGKIFY
jgi:hypothetical protein